jgi:hypothetical protein
VLLWERMPAELAAQVKGGLISDNDPAQMFGDVVKEITPDGREVYTWKSWEHLSVEEDIICPLEERREWTHGNCLNVTSEGDLLVSYRLTDTVGIVDKDTGGPVEVGAGRNLSPAPSYLVVQRAGSAIRQRNTPAQIHLLPSGRG